MPQNITVTTPEVLGTLSVPSTGDPRDSGPIRAAFQKLLNMIAGGIQTATPTGTVLAFSGAAAPAGWLLANGQAVSRTDYAALFTAIGTAFGTGNGTTTFNLPDLRGRTVIGVGQGAALTARALAQTGGEEAHALTLQELPSHSHTAPTGVTTPDGGAYEVAGTTQTYSTYDYAKGAPTDVAGGNMGHNTMPPFLALNYIVRA